MSRPTEGELYKELQALVKWEAFALSLPGIKKTPDIDIITRDHPNDAQAQKLSLFSLWLRRSPNASWQDVINALETAQELNLAKQLKEKQIGASVRCETQEQKYISSLGPGVQEDFVKPVDIKGIVNCIKDTINRNFAKLGRLFDPSIHTVSAELFTNGIISNEVRNNPSTDRILQEFYTGLDFMKTLPKVLDHCNKFFSALHDQGGPLRIACDALKEDIIKTVKKLGSEISFD